MFYAPYFLFYSLNPISDKKALFIANDFLKIKSL